jgi:hypothetical protein
MAAADAAAAAAAEAAAAASDAAMAASDAASAAAVVASMMRLDAVSMATSVALLQASAAFSAAFADRKAARPTFPNKPIRIVVTFPPGGSADAVVRLLTPRLTKSWASRWWWTTARAPAATSA